MQCPTCGAQVQPGQRYCAECGARLARACASCGAGLPEAARFCPDCGTPTGAAAPARPAGAAPPEGPARRPEPSAVPVDERAATLAAGPAHVAERRLVSVLFCDLVGFTRASEARDAEETRELLTAYYELARERVERYGGTIEKFIGDAVMAVWGVPTAREDDAERAVRAALDLVAAVPRLGRGEHVPAAAAPTGDAPGALAARAAVLSGEAAVTLGAQGQGMVAGDLVNTASRLQSVAPAGSVLVGEATRAATERAIAYEPAGEPELRGRAAPVAAWRALRTVALVGGRFGGEEHEPPFVGRDSELRFLTEMYHAAARERRLRLVSVTGQAGIGKSRLARELEKYLDGIAETVHWHRGRCPSYGQGVTFWAVGEMVRRRAGIAEGDDPATTAERLREMLAEYVPDPGERERIEPALRALLGLDTRGWSVTETGELFVAWRTLFERIAEQGPVVLVFEDLQWADDGLVAFIQHLLEWSRTQPILVVTLARPEFLDAHPTWGAGLRNFASLHLEPLPEGAIIEMLEGLIPGIPGAAARAIAARAEGVPLYSVETVRMLLAQGVLAREEGRLRLTGDIGAVAIPDSLRGLVAARLDMLAADERALLQDAAVLGQSFGIETLAAVTGAAPEVLGPRLRELVRRELLRLEQDPRSPERGQYLWVQAVIREVAYATLAKRDRRTRHLAAARYFETLGDEEVADILADHYVEAWRASTEGAEADALAGQARVALRAASERAERLRNWRQAASLVTRALEVTADPSERPALLERAGDLLMRGGAPTDAEVRFREALAALPADAPRDTRARLSARVASTILTELRVPEALAFLESVLPELGEELDGPGRIALEGQLGRAYALDGREAPAVAALERTIEAGERLELPDVVIDALISYGSVGTWSNRPSGLAMLFGSAELARRAGLVSSEIRALNNLAVWAEEADPPLATALNARILEICDRTGYEPITWLVDRPLDLIFSEGLDRSRAMAAELAERVAPGSLEEQSLRQALLIIEALAGDEAAFDATDAQLESSVQRSPESEGHTDAARSIGATLLGRPQPRGAVRGREGFVARAIQARGLTGLMERDRTAIRGAIDELGVGTTWDGPGRRGMRAVLEAGLSLLDAITPVALERYLEGIAQLRASERVALWAIAVAALVRVAGLDAPGVAEAEAAARRELERIGARGALAMLDRAVAATAEGLPASGADGRRAARARSTVS